MQKYGVSNSSWMRMICAPCFAACAHQPLGGGDVRATSQPQANCIAATVTSRFGTIQMRRLIHANTFPGFRMPFGSSACLSSRMVEISAGVRDSGR